MAEQIVAHRQAVVDIAAWLERVAAQIEQDGPTMEPPAMLRQLALEVRADVWRADPETPERCYYILDARACVGNCALFWCPNGNGYTCELHKAGLYTLEQAQAHRDTDIPVPMSVVRDLMVTHVRLDHLRERVDFRTWSRARRDARERTLALPRRGDEDWKESTQAPLFLIQRRRFAVNLETTEEWDSDAECFRDADGTALTEEDVVKRGHGTWEWDTVRVAFTREEAERHTAQQAYNGPFRVYSVPCIGELRTLVQAQTDYDPTLFGKPNREGSRG